MYQILLDSFNPCFYGTRSQTIKIQADGMAVCKFQSLFLWNSLSDVNEAVAIQDVLV